MGRLVYIMYIYICYHYVPYIYQHFTKSRFQFEIVGKRPPGRPYNMHFLNQRPQLD